MRSRVLVDGMLPPFSSPLNILLSGLELRGHIVNRIGKPGDLPCAPDFRREGARITTRRCICNSLSTIPLAVKVLPRYIGELLKLVPVTRFVGGDAVNSEYAVILLLF